MTLGDYIKEYRTSHDMSMDAFSERSGISKAYISLLEKNRHPKTGKEIAPSIQCIKQAADGMGMDFNTLFSMIDGNVTLEPFSSFNPSQEADYDIVIDDLVIEFRNSRDKDYYKRLLIYYSQLNKLGKAEALKRIEELSLLQHYNDSLLNAAHERTDIEVTEEMKNHDNDIMDDDNF